MNDTVPHFDGADYEPARDDARLTSQLRRIWNVISDGRWYSLEDISQGAGAPTPSVSAQLRHLRKPRFGAHRIERRHRGRGLYEYRLADRHPGEDG